MVVDLMKVPAAFGNDNAKALTDSKTHFDVFVAMIHPENGTRHKYHYN